MLDVNAATSQQHLEGDKQLKQHEQHPDRDHVSRPEQKESEEQVKYADQSNHAAIRLGRAFDVKQLVKLLRLFLLAHPEDDHVQDASQSDHYQNQHVSKKLSLVNHRYEEIALEEK